MSDHLIKFIRKRLSYWRQPGGACCIHDEIKSAVIRELKLLLEELEPKKSSLSGFRGGCSPFVLDAGVILPPLSDSLKTSVEEWAAERSIDPKSIGLTRGRGGPINLDKKTRKGESNGRT